MTISQHLRELRAQGEYKKADALYDAYVTLTKMKRRQERKRNGS